jgi:hypothetical protein
MLHQGYESSVFIIHNLIVWVKALFFTKRFHYYSPNTYALFQKSKVKWDCFPKEWRVKQVSYINFAFYKS